MQYILDILLPYGAYRLYHRGLIGVPEAVLLALFSLLYCLALILIVGSPFTLDFALLHFSTCVVAAGSLDPLVNRGSAAKLIGWRLMFIGFGFGFSLLLGMRSGVFLIGNLHYLDDADDKGFIKAWIGLFVCLLSTMYFFIRLYREIGNKRELQ